VRIAVLNWRDLAHRDAGGAEVFVHEVACRWSDLGHDVTLFTSRGPNLGAHDEVGDGGRIVRTGHVRDGSHHVMAPCAVARDRPDLVLESINTIPYMLPLRRRTPPFLPLVHQLAKEVWDEHLPRPLAGIARAVEPRLYFPYRKTYMAAVSDSTRADLVAAGVQKVGVIPQGGIGEQPERSKEQVPTFLFVGRLAANKRPDHAIDAFSLVRRTLTNARLWMVGEGPMRASLTKRGDPGVEFLGWVPREELLDRMGRAHLLLVTSVREGWGLVVTEANACGTPAVAYDVPGLRDSVLDGRTGILTEPKPQALAATCEGLVSSLPTLAWKALATEARNWGQSRTWDRTAEVLLRELVTLRPPIMPSDRVS
jgi:glycosyltransferase involved in cell wall biosynthesis